MLRPAPELSLRLADDTTSSFAARRALRRLLGDEANTPFGEAALLGVTELVNNATMYNKGGFWLSVWQTAGNAIRVRSDLAADPFIQLAPVGEQRVVVEVLRAAHRRHVQQQRRPLGRGEFCNRLQDTLALRRVAQGGQVQPGEVSPVDTSRRQGGVRFQAGQGQ